MTRAGDETLTGGFLDPLKHLAGEKSESPALAWAVAMIPGVGALADAGSALIKRRRRQLFDELDYRHVPLTDDALQSDNLLHRIVITIKAVERAATRQKVKVLARLLEAGLSEACGSVDEFEEFIYTVDTLTLRELHCLTIVEKWQLDHPWGPQTTVDSWNALKAEISSSLHMPVVEVPGFLTRLTRTGCYEIQAGGGLGVLGGTGYVTPLYTKLKGIIRDLDTLVREDGPTDGATSS